jgi:membrane-anchored protein YejM (alkaline phosphatase superfamily)
LADEARLLSFLVEVAGWAGATLILLAYLLLSAGRLTGQSLSYQLMNVVGAAGFIVNGWWHGALPSAVLNVIWLMIGAIATWRILKKRRSSTSAM